MKDDQRKMAQHGGEIALLEALMREAQAEDLEREEQLRYERT